MRTGSYPRKFLTIIISKKRTKAEEISPTIFYFAGFFDPVLIFDFVNPFVILQSPPVPVNFIHSFPDAVVNSNLSLLWEENVKINSFSGFNHLLQGEFFL